MDSPRKKESGGEALAGCAIYLLLFPVGVALHGIYLSLLWTWYVVPVFTSAPHIGIARAIGLSAIASLVIRGMPSKKKEERRTWDYASEAFTDLLALSLALAMAWAIKAVWL